MHHYYYHYCTVHTPQPPRHVHSTYYLVAAVLLRRIEMDIKDEFHASGSVLTDVSHQGFQPNFTKQNLSLQLTIPAKQEQD